MNVFISQPMRGKTAEEIQTERQSLIERAHKKYGGDVTILDSYFGDFDGNALAFLAKSIETLSKADVAIFAQDWERARGCRIEYMCCKEYGVKVMQ